MVSRPIILPDERRRVPSRIKQILKIVKVSVGEAKGQEETEQARGRVNRLIGPACRASDLVKSQLATRTQNRPMGITDIFKLSGRRSPRSIRHKGKRVSQILEAHERFVRGDETGARADFSGAKLSNADFGRANLAYADFHGANLNGANMREAKLASADLSKAQMRKADLRKADLTEANLSGADLAEAAIAGTELFRADLRGAILRGADLGAANLRDARIQGADFSGASLKTTILRETNLDGVDLSGLDLSTTLLPRDYKPAGGPGGGKN
jgi:uncharacterized protein YjbI with pentapeptide repeats